MAEHRTGVQEANDAELEAYLERELSTQRVPGVKPTPAASTPAEHKQGVLALAAEEEQWLSKLPPREQWAKGPDEFERGTGESPEHLRPQPAPAVSPVPAARVAQPEAPWAPVPAPLPGLAAVPPPAQPGWHPPPSRAPWLVTGALAGVSAASVLVAAMLWLTRDTVPEAAHSPVAQVPAGAVAAVASPPVTPAPAPEPSVKSSPLLRQPDPHLEDWIAAAHRSTQVLPGAVVPWPEAAAASKAPSPEPVAVKEAPPKPREPVQARRVRAVEPRPVRRHTDDPSLAELEEEELPGPRRLVAAPAPEPVKRARPAPPAAPKPGEYDEFDREFARELGFTEDAVRRVPESRGVKSVWVPPAPGEELPLGLTPADIQKVVASERSALASCIQRHKESSPGSKGGRFVMRWFIRPSGFTYDVEMETRALRGTELATCIERLVRGLRFPKHQRQMEAIRFPFTF